MDRSNRIQLYQLGRKLYPWKWTGRSGYKWTGWRCKWTGQTGCKWTGQRVNCTFANKLVKQDTNGPVQQDKIGLAGEKIIPLEMDQSTRIQMDQPESKMYHYKWTGHTGYKWTRQRVNCTIANGLVAQDTNGPAGGKIIPLDMDWLIRIQMDQLDSKLYHCKWTGWKGYKWTGQRINCTFANGPVKWNTNEWAGE